MGMILNLVSSVLLVLTFPYIGAMIGYSYEHPTLGFFFGIGIALSLFFMKIEILLEIEKMQKKLENKERKEKP